MPILIYVVRGPKGYSLLQESTNIPEGHMSAQAVLDAVRYLILSAWWGYCYPHHFPIRKTNKQWANMSK